MISEGKLNEIISEVIDRVLNESRPKRVSDPDSIYKNKGRRPTRIRSRIRQIKDKVGSYGLTSRRYKKEDLKNVLSDYNSVISSFGCEFTHDKGRWIDQPQTENGCDRGVRYRIRLTFNDGSIIGGDITIVGYGSKENPLAEFETDFSLMDKTFSAVNVENLPSNS